MLSNSHLYALDRADIELDSMHHEHTNSDRPYVTDLLKELQPSVDSGMEAQQIDILGKGKANDRQLEEEERGEDDRTLAQDLAVPTASNSFERSGRDQLENEKTKQDPIPPSASTSSENSGGWLYVYNEYKKIDSARIQQMDEYIDTLLTFAGLFSAALTAFLVQVYTELRPDNTQLTSPMLLDISRQLHAISLGQAAPVTNVSLPSADPLKSLVTTTSLWFVSLILALSAALFGILIKQWLREYMRWVEIYPPMHAIHVREYRNRALEKWRMEGIVMTISECLETGLVLFFLGLAVLMWRVNTAIAQVISVSIGLVLLAAIVAILSPAWNRSSPYRISAASFLLQGWGYLMIRLWRLGSIMLIIIMFPVRIFNNCELKNWHKSLMDHTLHHFNVSAYTSWAEIDMKFNLPNEIKRSIQDICKSLFWLTSHQTVPENLVIQCLSDLPGTSVRTRSSEQRAGNEKTPHRQQFTVHCHTLLFLMRYKHILADPKEIDDLEKLFTAKLPDRTKETKRPSLPPRYKYISFSTLSHAVRKADDQSRNILSAYFFSLVEDLLGSQQFVSKDADFDLAENLLHILILLWYCSDYHKVQMSKDIGRVGISTNPAAQSFYWLQKIFDKLLLQFRPEQVTSHHSYSRARYNSIVCLLVNHDEEGFTTVNGVRGNLLTYGSLLDTLIITSPNDMGTLSAMRIAQRFVEYNREELSPFDNANSSENGHQTKTQKLIEVFWDTAKFVLQFDVKQHPNIPAEDRQAFLVAIQTVLRASARTSRALQGWHYAYFASYVFRYRSRLPDGFVSTLREAERKGVINISEMLSDLNDLESARSITEGIPKPDSFWNALEISGKAIKPSLESYSDSRSAR